MMEASPPPHSISECQWLFVLLFVPGLASCYSFECSCPSAAWLSIERSVEFLLISQVFKTTNELNITMLL